MAKRTWRAFVAAVTVVVAAAAFLCTYGELPPRALHVVDLPAEDKGVNDVTCATRERARPGRRHVENVSALLLFPVVLLQLLARGTAKIFGSYLQENSRIDSAALHAPRLCQNEWRLRRI